MVIFHFVSQFAWKHHRLKGRKKNQSIELNKLINSIDVNGAGIVSQKSIAYTSLQNKIIEHMCFQFNIAVCLDCERIRLTSVQSSVNGLLCAAFRTASTREPLIAVRPLC